jgi:hypothetical protein
MSDIGKVPYTPRPDPCRCCSASSGERHSPGCPELFASRDSGDIKTVSDGGSSNYYKLPAAAVDLQDLIEDKEMSFARGNLFKALYRMGEKDGIDVGYDLKKMQWFLDRMKQMHKGGKRL